MIPFMGSEMVLIRSGVTKDWVSGFWSLVSGQWFMVPGFWFMVYGSWFMVHG